MRRLEVLGAPRPLRIAHVITRLINGGADENTVISCNQAVRSGHHVILVHGAQTRPEILATVDERVRIVELPSLVRPIAPLGDLKALGDLVRTFHRLRPDVVHTHTSKAGILVLTKIFAQELAPHGVTVNALAPSGIKGPAVDRAPPEAIARLVATVPVGRLGEPAEVGAAAVYLASDLAATSPGRRSTLTAGGFCASGFGCYASNAMTKSPTST